MLVFRTTLDRALLLLDELVASNGKEKKILTTQAQPPKQLQTRGGVTVDVLDRVFPHKWPGCLLHPGGYTIMHTLISIFKQLHGHFLQTDGS